MEEEVEKVQKKYKIKTEPVVGVEERIFREDGRPHRYVRVYLEADDEADLEKINSVQYELHPSFREQVRLSIERDKNFEIKFWTYGFFDITARLFPEKLIKGEVKGEPIVVKGKVKWNEGYK